MNSKVNTNLVNESNFTVETPIKSVDESKEVEARLTDNAVLGILPSRYLRKNSDGETTESIDEMFWRVADNVAGAEQSEPDQEKWADEFHKQMTELRFMPNSPTLMNAGTDMNQLSACFVLEPEDDMEDIFETAKQAALTFQSGGGVGYAFSHLRPMGAYINSTGGEASGPVSFMRVFDETCNQVKQGGKRRGAQMGILRADHPDIGRFVTAKRDEGDLSNFNISVGTTDEFVDAVKNDEMFTLYDPDSDYKEAYTVREATAQFYNPEYKDNPVDAYGPGEGAPVKSNIWRDYADEMESIEGVALEDKWAEQISLNEGEPMELPARFIWDIMIDGAWQNGEPGLFNFSASNREHSFDVDEYPDKQMNATNPCAEQMLMEYEACNLGHINLSLILEEDANTFQEHETSDWKMPKNKIAEYISDVVDFSELDRTIQAGVRFLDNVVTQSDFPVQEIEDTVAENRKIGLGIMGFAQLLYQMGIPYGSHESFQVARFMMRYIDHKGTDYSNTLAKERGVFGEWEQSKYADPTEYAEWFENHTGLPAEDYPDGYKLRNHNITTIAPTGTTSMIGDTSGGCEPVYNVANFKNVGDDIQGDDVLVEFDDYFLQTLEANGLPVDEIKEEAEAIMRDEDQEFDGVEDLPVPEKFSEIFVTTQDVTPKDHARMQRAFQEFTDSGISKTVNLPNEATRQDVKESYMMAFDDTEIGASIKGLTVYRDGARDEQVLTTRMDNKLDEDDEERDEQLAELHAEGEISDAAALELGLIEGEESEEQELCPDCGDGILEDTDDCAICPECWYSPCA
jgi:ribonucleoside-diphosphate reductase, adenosylcobalamin-dependent